MTPSKMLDLLGDMQSLKVSVALGIHQCHNRNITLPSDIHNICIDNLIFQSSNTTSQIVHSPWKSLCFLLTRQTTTIIKKHLYTNGLFL